MERMCNLCLRMLVRSRGPTAFLGKVHTISPVFNTMAGWLASRWPSVALLLDVSPKSPNTPMRSRPTLPTAGSEVKLISLDL